MKFNYKLRRLCGAYYGHPVNTASSTVHWSGSNVAYDSSGYKLISAVSNRIQVLDLQSHTVRTLPIEARSSIRTFALSPIDDTLLIVADVKNYVMLINFHRGVVLHRMKMKEKISCIRFSPCGNYIAFAQGPQVHVWCTPQTRHRTFSPMIKHREYTGSANDITSIDWSADSSLLIAGNKDSTVRIWSLHTTKNFEPVTLSGHSSSIVGCFTVSTREKLEFIYSISEDGSLVRWEHEQVEEVVVTGDESDDEEGHGNTTEDKNLDFFTDGQNEANTGGKSLAHQIVAAKWRCASRFYFNQEQTFVSSTSYSHQGKVLAVGFASGLFGVYEMPSVANIHTLSLGNGQLVKACMLNSTGEWLALACPRSQQLFVWEWRSETYVLKQRGHAFGMRCMAYSQDGVVVCTGGEDGKIKLWNALSGFCYVTMQKSHTAPITRVTFAKPSVVLSASLDGTVRAHDLHRYRTFRTLTTPTPVQFLSLAVDASGEIVCAGSTDPFHIYSWNLQTGKLLDIFTDHSGPVSSLCFQPNGGTLVSSSWDGTVRLWDMYKGNVSTDSLRHNTDVVCVTFRPDGKEICSGSVGGVLSFWDVESSKLKFEIDGRRDIAGGRKINDRMTVDNNAAGRYFTSICYSADGTCVLAGGNSKYVCIYEVSQQILLKKFQMTFNRSLDGVLDELNSKNMTEAGPLDDHLDPDIDEANYSLAHLPGAKRNDDGSRTSQVEVLTMAVSFSSTGREWATISGEGLHVYSLDEEMIFDPISLSESVTPDTVHSKLSDQEWATALRMALVLNEKDLIREVLDGIPYDAIQSVVRSMERAEPTTVSRALHAMALAFEDSPHIEFYLQWILEMLQMHGLVLDRHRAKFQQQFRTLNKVIQTRYDDLVQMNDENKYFLDFLTDQKDTVSLIEEVDDTMQE